MNQLSTYAQQLQAGLAWQGVGGPVPVSHSYVHTLLGAGNELGTIGY